MLAVAAVRARLPVAREARSLVGDVEHQPRVDPPDADRDRARPVPVRVVDEDVDDLVDHLLGGARDGRAGAGRRAQRAGVDRQHAAPPRRGSADELAQIDALVPVARVARDGQQRVDRRLQAVDLRERRGQLGSTAIAQLERLQLEAQRRQRRAELMRRRRGEGALALDEVAEPLRRRVERGGDRVDLGDAGSPGPHREVAVAQPARGDGQPLQRRRQPAAEDERGGRRRRDDRRPDAPEHEPRVARLPRGVAVAPRRTQHAADALAVEHGNGDDEQVALGRVGGLAGADHLTRDLGRRGRSGAREAAPRPVVDADDGVHRRHLDRIATLAGDVDRAAGGDRVALQAQQVLVAVAALQYERKRHGQQHDRGGRHAGDGQDQPPPHGASKR